MLNIIIAESTKYTSTAIPNAIKKSETAISLKGTGNSVCVI
ncbi:MAG: hypothetical protein ACEY3J_02760 [Arsenophonus sp.]